MIDIDYALWRLEGVFHSEDHFKQEFALVLNELLEDSMDHGTVRLEWRPEPGVYTDLAVCFRDAVVPTELKYKTRKAIVTDTRFDEEFDLKTHSAYDASTYSFVRDICRVERVAKRHETEGYAILLTNDPNYWREGSGAVYDAFRVFDGRRLGGTLDWRESTDWQKNSGVSDSLVLEHEYTMQWYGYSYRPDIVVDGNDEFRVLSVRTPPIQEEFI